MKSFLEQIRIQLFSSESSTASNSRETDNLISLGVLLWAVSEADEKFLPEELNMIRETLQKYSQISSEELPVVLRSVEIAAQERIDLYSFVSQVGDGISRDKKIEIIEHLFRIACVDGDLDKREHETIRQIYQLFGLDHHEFIDAKIKVKKEFGMDTAGL